MNSDGGTNSGSYSEVSWSDVPLELLKAELRRRQENTEKPSCGRKDGIGGYNVSAHIVAVLIILVLSTSACAFPIVVRRVPSIPVPHRFIFLSRHFGTGVLLATAFVHLLPTAFVALHDPCLPSFWNKRYPAAAGLIAMVAMLVTVGIEMFFASRGAGHAHEDAFAHLHQNQRESVTITRPRGPRSHSWRGMGKNREADLGAYHDISLDGETEPTPLQNDPRSQSNLHPASAAQTRRRDKDLDDENDSDADLELDELSPGREDFHDESGLLNGAPRHRRSGSRELPNEQPRPEEHHGADAHSGNQQKQLLQVLLLEAGILFHSVFIGMALSVAVGTSFVVLLVAISFHQTFEGFALGARIAAIQFPPKSIRPWLMALAYGTTTPIGQIIGLGVHKLYDPFSQTGLLMVGTMNSISSGLLLYAGLVTLLAEDFLSDESYATLKGKKRIQACCAVVGGATLMALVGAWA